MDRIVTSYKFKYLNHKHISIYTKEAIFLDLSEVKRMCKAIKQYLAVTVIIETLELLQSTCVSRQKPDSRAPETEVLIVQTESAAVLRLHPVEGRG